MIQIVVNIANSFGDRRFFYFLTRWTTQRTNAEKIN